MESTPHDHEVTCEICGSQNITFFNATERMYGLGGSFTYVNCQDCRTIYQKNKLSDYSKYYPQNYYSLDSTKLEGYSLKHKFRKFKKRNRDNYYFFKTGIIGKLLTLFRDKSSTHIANHLNLNRDMFILDVGCGGGEYIYDMAEIGFKHVYGLDPFVEQSISFDNGAKIFRGNIEDYITKNPYQVRNFDLIMFNHSFEHSPQPLKELEFAKKLLKPAGKILIRIPVSASYASDTYGEYWVNLDAPRHIYLLNEKSISILANKAELKVDNVYYDSNEDQFLGSEQYKLGIPLLADNSYAKSLKNSIFSQAQIRQYKKEAERLNELKLGDMAGFILSEK